MKIHYRPNRRYLDEAMKEEVTFDKMEELLEFLVIDGYHQFSKEDVYFSYYGYDDRIDWETYIVCTGKLGDENYMEKYHCPQCIGYMTFK